VSVLRSSPLERNAAQGTQLALLLHADDVDARTGNHQVLLGGLEAAGGYCAPRGQADIRYRTVFIVRIAAGQPAQGVPASGATLHAQAVQDPVRRIAEPGSLFGLDLAGLHTVFWRNYP
jgi:hypothetical protein